MSSSESSDQAPGSKERNKKEKNDSTLLEYSLIDYKKNIIPQILSELHHRNIQSVIVEGGSRLLSSFIQCGKWDEARVFTANKKFINGIKAPSIAGIPVSKEKIGEDELMVFRNNKECV